VLPSDDPSQLPSSGDQPALNRSIPQHADSAFPSGSFAFSGGIEGLAALEGWFYVAGLLGNLKVVLRHRLAGCECVALVQAWGQGQPPGDIIPAAAGARHAAVQCGANRHRLPRPEDP
jgi:urease accessory protein UreF